MAHTTTKIIYDTPRDWGEWLQYYGFYAIKIPQQSLDKY